MNQMPQKMYETFPLWMLECLSAIADYKATAELTRRGMRTFFQ